jgi:predicted aldo/keto reductase-like oxidoreductase
LQGAGQAGAQGPPGGSQQAGGQGGAQGGAQGGPPGGGRESATVTNPTALIKWVLQHESVATVVTNFSNYDQLEQNFSVAYDLAYTDSEKKFLADEKAVAALEFCQQCGSCRSGCEFRADIPTLMRSHMYALQYRDTEKARYTLASIPKGKGLEACANCDTCSARCVNSVNIARKVAELKGLSIC